MEVTSQKTIGVFVSHLKGMEVPAFDGEGNEKLTQTEFSCRWGNPSPFTMFAAFKISRVGWISLIPSLDGSRISVDAAFHSSWIPI